jgi:hypothetical protein
VSEPGPAAGSDRVADLVEQWELREAVGGVRGIVDSGLASTAFLLVYLVSGRRLVPALVAALATTVAVLVLRMVRHEPVRQALTGVFVVAVSAAIAMVTGRAANFYVVGIAVQVAYGVAYLVSLVIGWPLLGVVLASLAYCAASSWLSLKTRRPVVIGVIYILLWEGSVATYAASAAKLSISAYGSAFVAHALPQSAPPVAGLVPSAVVLVAVVVLAALGAARSLARTPSTSTHSRPKCRCASGPKRCSSTDR